jgi:hypothetical protein
MSMEIARAGIHPQGEAGNVVAVGSFAGLDQPVRLETPGGVVRVEWDWEARATDKGLLAFFAQFLQTGGLFAQLVDGFPRHYTSPNAPWPRDVAGALVLSVLGGHWRYRHIESMRFDTVSAGLLGMKRMPGAESVRRALAPVEEVAGLAWLRSLLFATWKDLLAHEWILDIDTTIKPVYGRKQEGAHIGYNLKKPGRPSHAYHTYWIGNIRHCLDVEVEAGDRHHACYAMPRLWQLLDSLPPECQPRLLRGDSGFGSEGWMLEAEQRGLHFLARLRMSRGVKTLAAQLERTGAGWKRVDEEWSLAEGPVRLHGWSRARRVIMARRWGPATKGTLTTPALGTGLLPELEIAEGEFEYQALCTSTAWAPETVFHSYRDRAICENGFDELKNQWGWCGYMTRDLKRSRFMALLVALVYNWWSLFVRLADPRRGCAEVITSRPLLLHGIARRIETGRQTTLKVCPLHAQAKKACEQLVEASRFLTELSTAPQLNNADRWRRIVERAFAPYLEQNILCARLEKPP